MNKSNFSSKVINAADYYNAAKRGSNAAQVINQEVKNKFPKNHSYPYQLVILPQTLSLSIVTYVKPWNG